jgi:hypothetical protein
VTLTRGVQVQTIRSTIFSLVLLGFVSSTGSRAADPPQDKQSIDCGLFGPHYAEISCPADRMHANCYCAFRSIWGNAKCECDLGAAHPPPPPPPQCKPAVLIDVTSGPVYRVNAEVSVTNTSTHKVVDHILGGVGIVQVASGIQAAATEAGLTATVVGGSGVRICGLNNIVTVIGALSSCHRVTDTGAVVNCQ